MKEEEIAKKSPKKCESFAQTDKISLYDARIMSKVIKSSAMEEMKREFRETVFPFIDANFQVRFLSINILEFHGKSKRKA